MFSRLPSLEREAATSTASFGTQQESATPAPLSRPLPHVCAAALAGVLFGYHVGVVNIPLEQIARDLGFAGSAFAKGFVVSICLVGALLGCAFSGTIADKYGRRRTLQLSAVPMIVGASFSAVASGPGAMWFGRFVVGIGLGIAGPVMSMYVSEISPTHVRGTLGSLCQIANCLGMLIAFLVSYWASYVLKWWRSCFWISIIPAVALAVGMQSSVESPRWLSKQSRAPDRQEDTIEVPWKILFSKPYSQAIGLGSALFALQQFSGINAMFYFSTTVFQNAGVTSDVAASVSVGVVNLGASFTAAYSMDRQGRRSLLLWSFGGMACAMVAQWIASVFSILRPFQGYLSLAGTLVYVFMFALGAGPVPSLLLPEIFQDRVRGRAISVCMCVHWVCNFTVGLLFLPAVQLVGISGLYSFFALACVCAFFFVGLFLPETKGRNLDELEISFIQKH